MALVIYWYDAFCFAIIGVAMLVSVYMLWSRKRGGGMEETIMYHSLLVPRLDTYYYNYNNNNNNNFTSWSQLWTSCWRGLHPAWLLAFRLTSFFLLAAFLSWDIHVWGASIFIYYTEWTFALVMLYFAIGSGISAYGCWLFCSKHGTSLNVQETEADGNIEESGSRKGDSNYYQEQTMQQAGFWGYLMQIVYQTCAGAVILTDVVFWGIIVPLLSNARLGLNLVRHSFPSNPICGTVLYRLSLFCVAADGVYAYCEHRPPTYRYFHQWTAISLVPASLLCAMELGLCCISVAYSLFWFFMVAVPFPRVVNTIGTFELLNSGSISCCLLRIVRTDCQSEGFSFFKSFS